MKLKITCKTDTYAFIEDLKKFQGPLKSITDSDLEKLKNSIITYGFSFPIFVWENNILDGHQRLKAVESLFSDGYEFETEMLPVVEIEAGSKKEAAEKLLLINSRYATIEQDGFELFVNDFDIKLPDIEGLIEIPEIDFTINDSPKDFESDLEKISVNPDDATILVERYDKWEINGKHILICCEISTDWEHWINFLKDDNDIFLPYASLFMFQSKKANNHRFVVIQPDTYICSKMLQIHVDLKGAESIIKL